MATQQEDLDTLKKKRADIVQSNFELMSMYLHMSPVELSHCGHKTVGSALEYSMRATVKEISKETAVFLKKWPD